MAGKICIALFVLASAMIVSTHAQDISAMLRNRPLVQRQISCILARNQCDVIGRQIKAVLPEAVNNNCHRCTRQHAQISRQLIGFMSVNYPTELRKIIQMYSRPRAL